MRNDAGFGDPCCCFVRPELASKSTMTFHTRTQRIQTRLSRRILLARERMQSLQSGINLTGICTRGLLLKNILLLKIEWKGEFILVYKMVETQKFPRMHDFRIFAPK